MITLDRVEGLVGKQIEILNRRNQNGYLISKEAKVIESTPIGRKLRYIPNSLRSEQGKYYHHGWGGVRTVFNNKPREINGEKFYLEIKGYGFFGKYLMPFHHTEGDLHYGMYFENAKKEFDILKLAEGIEGVRSQKPVALLEFSHDEFVKQGLRGMISLVFRSERPLSEAWKEFGKNEIQVAECAYKNYQLEGLEKTLEKLCKIEPRMLEQYPHIFREFSHIKKNAGYLVRMGRCPFRVLDGLDSEKRDDLKEAVYEAGKLYRQLVERSFLHLVPSLDNISLTGELMDFEDVESMEDYKAIRHSWRFMTNKFRDEKIVTFEDYLTLTLGDNFLGYPDNKVSFVDDFLNGVELGITPRETARRIIDMNRDKLEGLVNGRIRISK